MGGLGNGEGARKPTAFQKSPQGLFNILGIRLLLLTPQLWLRVSRNQGLGTPAAFWVAVMTAVATNGISINFIQGEQENLAIMSGNRKITQPGNLALRSFTQK
jgi:hypothetical protein